MNFYSFYKKFGLYAILVLVFAFFSIFAPHFFSGANFLNILRQVSIFGTAVIGATIVMIGGGADMSVGGMVAMGGIIAAMAMTTWGLPIWAAILLTILFCCLIGFLNGFLTVTLFIPGFITTLGMMLVLNGMAYVISGGYAIFGLPSEYAFLGQGYIGSGSGYYFCDRLCCRYVPDDQDVLWPQCLCAGRKSHSGKSGWHQCEEGYDYCLCALWLCSGSGGTDAAVPFQFRTARRWRQLSL